MPQNVPSEKRRANTAGESRLLAVGEIEPLVVDRRLSIPAIVAHVEMVPFALAGETCDIPQTNGDRPPKFESGGRVVGNFCSYVKRTDFSQLTDRAYLRQLSHR